MTDYEKFKREAKREEFRRKLEDGFCKARDVAAGVLQTAYEHRFEIGAAVLGATAVARTANKLANDAHDRRYRDRMQYDRRENTYYETRRRLSNQDNLNVRELMDAGLSKGEALKRLGLLK